ncbi:hypothetical protein B0J11DRAFT_534867 [Dendryphion nanum]|uniref:DUF1746 domain-containing protein n=1 Tax=Dendryphion nanum TaxID=256645 RepID=A0A9P9DIS0_9PLEO|nr:hypothetical protein B0J11DRAFT_534867 [Dendryphion nanum]
MNDEAESSAAGARHAQAQAHAQTTFDGTDAEVHFEHTAIEGDGDEEDEIDPAEDAQQREQRVKERRVDAKRKRVIFLDHLLRELDMVVFLEFITLYHLDCSFFWFFVRCVIHLSLLTPLPDLQLARQHDEHKPFLPLILFSFAINFFLHLVYAAPSAGEDTRGYLHGGLMIDFIGQQGPTSKWKLAGLDICILLLQCTMVSVHLKRRELKKNLVKISGGTPTPANGEGEGGAETNTTNAGEASNTDNPTSAPVPNADRDQDADAEERGVLRRTDTLSDTGADPDEEDALLPATSESGHTDALDLLSSGQAVVGDFILIDSLLQAHEDYNAFRQARSEGGSSAASLSPSTLRHLHNIRMRFGVGGG